MSNNIIVLVSILLLILFTFYMPLLTTNDKRWMNVSITVLYVINGYVYYIMLTSGNITVIKGLATITCVIALRQSTCIYLRRIEELKSNKHLKPDQYVIAESVSDVRYIKYNDNGTDTKTVCRLSSIGKNVIVYESPFPEIKIARTSFAYLEGMLIESYVFLSLGLIYLFMYEDRLRTVTGSLFLLAGVIKYVVRFLTDVGFILFLKFVSDTLCLYPALGLSIYTLLRNL